MHQQKSGDDDVSRDGQTGAELATSQLNADNNNTTHSFLKLLNDVRSGDALMKMVRKKVYS